MSIARTVLNKGLVITVLSVVISSAWAGVKPAKVEQVMPQVSSQVSSQVLVIGCRIRVTAEGEAVRIEAVATSREDVTGNYRLDIDKRSRDGASHNVQSGRFNLEADQEKILSTTFLGVSDADQFQAKLVVHSNSGSVSCVSP
jgi:hypothetical protein